MKATVHRQSLFLYQGFFIAFNVTSDGNNEY